MTQVYALIGRPVKSDPRDAHVASKRVDTRRRHRGEGADMTSPTTPNLMGLRVLHRTMRTDLHRLTALAERLVFGG